MRFARSCGRYLLEGTVGGRCEFHLQPTNARHSHSYFEACLVTRGFGRYHHAGEEWSLSPGDLFLAEPGAVHEISSWETRDLEIFFVSFTLAIAGSATGGGEEAVAAAFDAGRATLGAGAQELGAYVPLALRSESALAPAAAALFALEAMARLGGGTGIVSEEAGVGTVLDRASSVAEAAAALGISPRTLQRRTQAAFGRGARAEIERRTMNRAAHRLLMGYGVGETAAWLGETPDAFARRFRRVQGLSPGRYRSRFAPSHRTETATDHAVAP